MNFPLHSLALSLQQKKKDGAGKRKCEPMMQIALFPILPDTSLLFPAALRGTRTPLPLPAETGKT
ncbi:MAG: hypothetical protein HXN53_07865 [Prevotella nigrescens]|nr:hypothetical protein [Prevotella nigrescens]